MDKFSYRGKSCDMNCDNCEKCIYDVITNEDKDMKVNELSKITTCNVCPNSKCTDACASKGTLHNWFCVTKGERRLIDMSVLGSADVEIPTWCPLSLHKEKEEPKKKELSYKEKRDMWENIPNLCEWKNIKVNDIYHLPPIMGEKRKDIMITNVCDFSFQYRLLSKDPKKSSSAIYTTYKTAMWWKFLVKHKIINFNLVKN